MLHFHNSISAYLVASMMICAFLAPPAMANPDCGDQLTKVMGIRQTIQNRTDTKEEQVQLWEDFLAPGQIFSSPIFQKFIVKENGSNYYSQTNLHSPAVLERFFDTFNITRTQKSSDKEEHLASADYFLGIKERAKSLGISVEEFLEFSDRVTELRNNPERLKNFTRVFHQALPDVQNIAVSKAGIKNYWSENRWFAGFFGAAPIAAAALYHLDGGQVSVPLVAGLAAVAPTLFEYFRRNWISYKNRAEKDFKQNWVGNNDEVAEIEAKVAKYYKIKTQAPQPNVKLDISKPYESIVEKIESPKLKFEGMTEEMVETFGAELQKQSHEIIEQATARLAPIPGPERWADLELVSQSILKKNAAGEISKGNAVQSIRPLLQANLARAQADSKNLTAMLGDVIALSEKLSEAHEEAVLTQEQMIGRLASEGVSSQEKYIVENRIMILESHKEALASTLFTLKSANLALTEVKGTVENNRRFVAQVERSLEAGDIRDPQISKMAVDGLTALHAHAKNVRETRKLAAVNWKIQLPNLDVQSEVNELKQEITQTSEQPRPRGE